MTVFSFVVRLSEALRFVGEGDATSTSSINPFWVGAVIVVFVIAMLWVTLKGGSSTSPKREPETRYLARSSGNMRGVGAASGSSSRGNQSDYYDPANPVGAMGLLNPLNPLSPISPLNPLNSGNSDTDTGYGTVEHYNSGSSSSDSNSGGLSSDSGSSGSDSGGWSSDSGSSGGFGGD